MGINWGLLGRIASSGMAGHARGQIAGESEANKRQTAAEERQREIDRQAITDSILQSGERRAAEDQTRETEQYGYEVSQRPTTEARAAAETDRITRQNLPKPPDPMAGIRAREGEARITNLRSQIAERGRDKVPAFQRKLDAIAQASGGDLGQMHIAINEDPELFQQRANRTIRDYDVGAAAARARRAGKTGDSRSEERRYILKRVPELRREYLDTGEDLSAPEAYRIAQEEYGAMDGDTDTSVETGDEEISGYADPEPPAGPAGSGGGTATQHVPLEQRISELRQQGRSKEQARQILQAEGYDLETDGQPRSR